MSEQVPQVTEQETFLRAVFGNEQGYLFVSTLDRSEADRDKGWRDRGFVYPLQMGDILHTIRVSDTAGLDVYIAAQLYKAPQGRKKAQVKTCPSVWSDLDTANPYGVSPEPSVILETSPGRWHGFWRTPKALAGPEAEEWSRRIAYAHHREGADLGGWDLTQVLRVPGTHNHKYPAQPAVRLAKCDPTPIPWQAFEGLPAAPARRVTEATSTDPTEPPVPLVGDELAAWQQDTAPDRSGWAMNMTRILKDHGLADRLVEVALANHPIYLSKAREKWGNRESLIYDDIRRCLQRYRESPTIILELPAGGLRDAQAAPLRDDAMPTALAPNYPIKQIAASLAAAEDTPAPLVQGLLWSQRVHWVFSSPGTGKTLLMLATGLHVAAGRSFAGRQVTAGTVLLLEEDSSESVLGDYVQTLSDIYDTLPLATLPLYYNAVQGLRLSEPDGVAKVWAAVRACPTLPALVILDTCEKMLPSGEFTSRELAPLARVLQELTAAGIAVVVIDHTRKQPPQVGKDKAAAGPVDLIDLLYGGRGKSAMSDVMVHFSGSAATGLHITFAKFRGQPQEPLNVRFSDEAGWVFKAQPRKARTPNEHTVLKYFVGLGDAWVAKQDLCLGTGLPDRTAQRVLTALVERGWLKRQGEGRGTKYAADDITPLLTLEVPS